MNPDLWMPLHIGKYLLDTKHLDLAQHGAYLLLLMHYWQKGPLTDDDGELSRIVGADLRTWRKALAPKLRPFFSRHDDGKLHQKRADIELARADAVSVKRRAAALVRHHGNGKDPDPSGHANGHANASEKPVDNHANAPPDASEKHAKGMQMHHGCTPTLYTRPSILKDSSGEVCARESNPAPEAPSVVNFQVAKAVSDIAKHVGRAIHAKNYPPGKVVFRDGKWEQERDAKVQMAHVADPPGYPKARPLSREQLAVVNPARRKLAAS